MKKINTFFKNLWKDESGQGTAEYVLLLVIVVALVTAFRKQIMSAVTSKLDELNGKISGFSGDN